MIESLQLSKPERKQDSKNKHTREEFEKMDLKTLINWITTNMYPEDVLRCIRSGALSEKDKASLDEIEGSMPSGGGFSQDDLDAVRASEALPPSTIKKMFEQISSVEIMKQINSVSPQNRQSEIINLCRQAGLDYKIKNVRGKNVIYDIYDNQVDDNSALSQCASVQAIRARSMLAQRSGKARIRAKKIIQGKYPAFNKMTPTQVEKVGEIIDDMLDAKAEGDMGSIIGFANNLGYSLSETNGTIIKDGKMLMDDDVEDLIDQLALLYIKKYNVSFGKRKTKKSTRRSPMKSATLFKVGTSKKGVDGNRWVVKKTIKGVKRWFKK